MKPSTRRRLLLVALVVAAAASLVASKVRAEDVEFDGAYHWYRDYSLAACSSYRWLQVDAHRVPGLCSRDGQAAPERTSCAFHAPSCLVISPYTESEARRIAVGRMTLFEHELRHLEGWVHPKQ